MTNGNETAASAASPGANRHLSGKTVIPISVAISVIAGSIAAYVTFSKMTEDLREKVAAIDGRLQGSEKSTQTVLLALDDSAKEMYRRRVNVLSLLEAELARFEAHLAAWAAPSIATAKTLRGQPDGFLSFPTGYPPTAISGIAFDSAIRGLPNTDVVLALDGLAAELGEFNTMISRAGGSPPGLFASEPIAVPRLLPGISDDVYTKTVGLCNAKRDAMLILLKRLRGQVNTVRAEALARSSR